MFFGKQKKGIGIRIGHKRLMGFRMKEIFIGHRSIFALIGFIVGGVLVGRSVWEYLMTYFSLSVVIVIGFLVFLLSGLVLHEFDEENQKKE